MWNRISWEMLKIKFFFGLWRLWHFLFRGRLWYSWVKTRRGPSFGARMFRLPLMESRDILFESESIFRWLQKAVVKSGKEKFLPWPGDVWDKIECAEAVADDELISILAAYVKSSWEMGYLSKWGMHADTMGLVNVCSCDWDGAKHEETIFLFKYLDGEIGKEREPRLGYISAGNKGRVVFGMRTLRDVIDDLLMVDLFVGAAVLSLEYDVLSLESGESWGCDLKITKEEM